MHKWTRCVCVCVAYMFLCRYPTQRRYAVWIRTLIEAHTHTCRGCLHTGDRESIHRQERPYIQTCEPTHTHDVRMPMHACHACPCMARLPTNIQPHSTQPPCVDGFFFHFLFLSASFPLPICCFLNAGALMYTGVCEGHLRMV